MTDGKGPSSGDLTDSDASTAPATPTKPSSPMPPPAPRQETRVAKRDRKWQEKLQRWQEEEAKAKSSLSTSATNNTTTKGLSESTEVTPTVTATASKAAASEDAGRTTPAERSYASVVTPKAKETAPTAMDVEM